MKRIVPGPSAAGPPVRLTNIQAVLLAEHREDFVESSVRLDDELHRVLGVDLRVLGVERMDLLSQH